MNSIGTTKYITKPLQGPIKLINLYLYIKDFTNPWTHDFLYPTVQPNQII